MPEHQKTMHSGRVKPDRRSFIKPDRRSFIKIATAFALALPGLVRGRSFFARRLTDDDMAGARQRLLAMVNQERREHGLSPLEVDALASRVAEDHAREMVNDLFLSHWGRDGRKPYHRYSFAGGTEATQENGASYNDISTANSDEIEESAAQLHQSMIDEKPPDDGHRQTILFPYHTHVGFGVAVNPDHLRIVELYVSRYAEIPRMRRNAAPGAVLNFSGRLLNPKHSLEGIHVYYEPLPKPPSLAWLRQLRSYTLPDAHEELWPRLTNRDVYDDGTKGTIEISSRGDFRTPVTLSKAPGISTIVVWIQRRKDEEPFPITNVCIRCE
jgi:hypothetical protein